MQRRAQEDARKNACKTKKKNESTPNVKNDLHGNIAREKKRRSETYCRKHTHREVVGLMYVCMYVYTNMYVYVCMYVDVCMYIQICM